MSGAELDFTLAWTDIDPAVLPRNARQPGTNAFRQAVNDFLRRQYESIGGKARIVFDEAARTVRVSWAMHGGFESVAAQAADALNSRDFGRAIPLLKALIAKHPGDALSHYNLGMVYSDQGKLGEAEQHLAQAVSLNPGHANAIVALGVVHARAGDLRAAVESLRKAVELDPENTFAHQNLGACLLKESEFEQAEVHFRASLRGDRENMQSQLGLAQTLESVRRFSDADEIYQKIISAAGHSPVGSLAKEGRTRIAHALLRKAGDERPDVVMYCLGALERFEAMTEKQVEAIGHEIAILGMRGLDINDPAKRYTLKSLPGDFSGLHLVSIMYAAFQKTSPGTDVGIDLSREYAQALALLGETK